MAPPSYTVGGEPADVLVEYVGNVQPGDNTTRVLLAPSDSGTERSVTVGERVYVTFGELSKLQRTKQVQIVPPVAPSVPPRPPVAAPVVAAPSPTPVSPATPTPSQGS